jgi:hypothetical protein
VFHAEDGVLLRSEYAFEITHSYRKISSLCSFELDNARLEAISAGSSMREITAILAIHFSPRPRKRHAKNMKNMFCGKLLTEREDPARYLPSDYYTKYLLQR